MSHSGATSMTSVSVGQTPYRQSPGEEAVLQKGREKGERERQQLPSEVEGDISERLAGRTPSQGNSMHKGTDGKGPLSLRVHYPVVARDWVTTPERRLCQRHAWWIGLEWKGLE